MGSKHKQNYQLVIIRYLYIIFFYMGDCGLCFCAGCGDLNLKNLGLVYVAQFSYASAPLMVIFFSLEFLMKSLKILTN